MTVELVVFEPRGGSVAPCAGLNEYVQSGLAVGETHSADYARLIRASQTPNRLGNTSRPLLIWLLHRRHQKILPEVPKTFLIHRKRIVCPHTFRKQYLHNILHQNPPGQCPILDDEIHETSINDIYSMSVFLLPNYGALTSIHGIACALSFHRMEDDFEAEFRFHVWLANNHLEFFSRQHRHSSSNYHQPTSFAIEYLPKSTLPVCFLF